MKYFDAKRHAFDVEHQNRKLQLQLASATVGMSPAKRRSLQVQQPPPESSQQPSQPELELERHLQLDLLIPDDTACTTCLNCLHNADKESELMAQLQQENYDLRRQLRESCLDCRKLVQENYGLRKMLLDGGLNVSQMQMLRRRDDDDDNHNCNCPEQKDDSHTDNFEDAQEEFEVIPEETDNDLMDDNDNDNEESPTTRTATSTATSPNDTYTSTSSNQQQPVRSLPQQQALPIPTITPVATPPPPPRPPQRERVTTQTTTTTPVTMPPTIQSITVGMTPTSSTAAPTPSRQVEETVDPMDVSTSSLHSMYSTQSMYSTNSTATTRTTGSSVSRKSLTFAKMAHKFKADNAVASPATERNGGKNNTTKIWNSWASVVFMRRPKRTLPPPPPPPKLQGEIVGIAKHRRPPRLIRSTFWEVKRHPHHHRPQLPVLFFPVMDDKRFRPRNS